MLEQILAEVIATREMLMVQISMVRADLEKLSRKVDGIGKRLTNVETDLAGVEARVDTLEGKTP